MRRPLGESSLELSLEASELRTHAGRGSAAEPAEASSEARGVETGAAGGTVRLLAAVATAVVPTAQLGRPVGGAEGAAVETTAAAPAQAGSVESAAEAAKLLAQATSGTGEEHSKHLGPWWEQRSTNGQLGEKQAEEDFLWCIQFNTCI